MNDQNIFSAKPAIRLLSKLAITESLKTFAAETHLSERTGDNYHRQWGQKKGNKAFTHETIKKYFGSMANAMREAKVEYSPCEKTFKDDVDKDLKLFFSQRTFKDRTFAKFVKFSSRNLGARSWHKFYPNWVDAASSLGYEVSGKCRSKRFTDDELIDAFERVWRWTYEQKRARPSTGDFKKYDVIHKDGVKTATLIFRFGPLKAFAERFSQYKLNKITKADLVKRGSTALRKAISPKLRYEIFQRDGNRCVVCGRQPPEVKLHVDHRTPVTRMGDNNTSNLSTLCEECNLGKSNRFIDSPLAP